MKAVVRKSAEAEQKKDTTSWGSLCWLANQELTASPKMTVGRVVIKKGQHNPKHSHGNCQELLYLLAGRLEHAVGDESVTLEPGDTLVVEAGVPHNAQSIGDVDADMIVVYDTGARHFKKEL